MPCGHLCICGNAVCTASVMKEQKCFICRKPVDQLLEVAEARTILKQSGRRVYTVCG
jgi:hypothetical protein